MFASRSRSLRFVAALLIAAVGGLVCVYLLADSRSRMLVVNSFALAGATTLGALPLGSLLAWLLVRVELPGRRVLLGLLICLLFVPLYLQAAAWEAGFGRLGWQTLSSGQVARPLLTGWRAAIWIHVLAAVPWVTLIVGAGLRQVERELEEDALLDAGPGSVFLWVTLPRAAAAVGVAAVWVFVTTANEMTVADLYFITTFARELYNGFALGDTPAEILRSAAPGMAMTACSILAALLCLAWLAPPAEQTWGRPRRWNWGAVGWLGAGVAALFVVLAVLVPVVSLAIKAGWIATEIDGQRVRHWSFAKFREIVFAAPWRFRREFYYTLVIGILTATLTILTAAPLTWWVRGRPYRSLALLVACAAAVVTPGPLLGLGLLWTFSQIDFGPVNYLVDRTVFLPVVALSLRALPYAAAICWYGFRTVGQDVLDAGKLDGAGAVNRWLRLATPQRLGVLWAAWLASFAIATGDLAASILVTPAGVTTVAHRVFGLIHSGVRYQEAGVCLVATALFTAVAGIGWLALIRGRAD